MIVSGQFVGHDAVVTSPLIALQRDQVQSSEEAEVGTAALLNATLSESRRRAVLDRLAETAFSFLAAEQFGEGRVQRYEGGKVVVLFDAQGYKTLDVNLVVENGLIESAGSRAGAGQIVSRETSGRHATIVEGRRPSPEHVRPAAYQPFQWTMRSSGSRGAGLNSVPRV